MKRTALLIGYIILCFNAAAAPLVSAASRFDIHLENDFSAYYNGVSGPGKSDSSLTEGLNYVDTLSVYGGGQLDDSRYNFNITGRTTDDENNDIKRYSLANVNFQLTTPYHAVNIGDTYEFFSPYTLTTAVKGGSYNYRGGAVPWIPQVKMLWGHAAPRWDSLWGGNETEATERTVYGTRVMYDLPFGIKAGANVVHSDDSDPVTPGSAVYDNAVYSVDFNYQPFSELLIGGESAFNDSRVTSQDNRAGEALDGNALRINAAGEFQPFHIKFEYERVTPDFDNPLGSAIADREKVKLNGQYEFNKNIQVYTNFLWFRDNLDGRKSEGRTDVWRPEVALACNNPFSRPAGFAKLTYRKELSERESERVKFDDLFYFNYRDEFGIIETDTNLGYNLRNQEDESIDNEEFIYNTTLRSLLSVNSLELKPNIQLGGWTLKDELSTAEDRAYKYSCGLGIGVPAYRITSSMAVGVNELKIDNGDDSTKTFGNLSIYWTPGFMPGLNEMMLYLKGGYNDFDFSTSEKDFREEKLLAGVKIKY
ncbi:MAG: hypothetical protein ACOC7W_04380 [Desulfosalsimonas sp.]